MISTIIAKVILKILEAFGIKPTLTNSYTRSVETLNPAKVSQDSLGHKIEPPKPRTLGTLGSAGPVTVDAQTGGPLINHVPRPLDDAHFGGLSTAGDVATEPAPILPPESTDPTDAPEWIDAKYGDDWQTHVNK